MHPNLLLCACTVSANPQDILHLRVADKQDIPRNEEPDALTARRARQTAPVSPHLTEIARLLQSSGGSRSAVHADVEVVVVGETGAGAEGAGAVLLRLCFRHVGRRGVGGQEGRLAEEVRVAQDARVDADGQHGALGAVAVDVHEVQLGFGAVVLHRVVGGRVDVPADEVDGFVDAVVVEGEVRGVEVHGAVDGGRAFGAAGLGKFERRTITPVVIGARYLTGVVEDGDVCC